MDYSPQGDDGIFKALTDKLTHKLKLPPDLLNMPICQQKRGSSPISSLCLKFSMVQLAFPYFRTENASSILAIFSALPGKMCQA